MSDPQIPYVVAFDSPLKNRRRQTSGMTLAKHRMMR
jgi:hypothetical protein